MDDLMNISGDPEELINYLDVLFTHGQLSQNTRNIIKEALLPLNWEGSEIWRARMALYLILISPDYVILK